jgi:D-serine deaminase-like pyridoxal phosphate-dependent protein
MPFQPAALVLTQVIDHQPERGEVTLDLGAKAVSSDPPTPDRFRLVGAPPARLLQQTEEHAVVDTAGHSLSLGDYALAIPGHVCTTVFRYPGSWFVDAAGHVTGWNEHTARDRGPLAD